MKKEENLKVEVVEKKRADKFEFTEEDIVLIAKLAQNLMPLRAIANYFGISLSTFERRMGENPEIKDAIRQGRARALSKLNSVALKKALGGDVGLLKYYISKYEEHFTPELEKKELFSPENLIHHDSREE